MSDNRYFGLLIVVLLILVAVIAALKFGEGPIEDAGAEVRTTTVGSPHQSGTTSQRRQE